MLTTTARPRGTLTSSFSKEAKTTKAGSSLEGEGEGGGGGVGDAVGETGAVGVKEEEGSGGVAVAEGGAEEGVEADGSVEEDAVAAEEDTLTGGGGEDEQAASERAAKTSTA